MRLKLALAAAAILLLTAPSAFAIGSFKTLPIPTVIPPPPQKAIATPVAGLQNQDSDPLRILSGPALGGGVFGFPTSFMVLAQRNTEVFLNNVDVGSFQDYVFLDQSDNKLVFGSRLTLGLRTDGSTFNSGNNEINDIFRSGFTGYSAAAAWAFKTNRDLRLYLSARTDAGLKQGALVYSPDVVALRSDINSREGAPFSGLFLIKTDAPSFKLADNAVRLRQGGEEGQLVTNVPLMGYIPWTAPVPEPSSWMLMLAGLGIAGVMVRRRLRS